MLPVVSVVVATRNRPRLLRSALDSIHGQDYTGRIECIVVFDHCAHDHSLIDRYTRLPDRVTRVVDNARVQGLAGARNTGILEATGDFVAFCDDDDTWESTKVSSQVHQLTTTGALTSVTGIAVQFEDRTTVRIPRQARITHADLVRHRVMEAHPSTVMVRRDALLHTIGLVDERIPGSYGEDFDWILRAAGSEDIVVVGRALVIVRWGQSMFSRNWQVIVDAIDYLLEKHPALSSDRQGHARVLGRRAFALAALGRRRASIRQAMSTIRRSWKERRAYLALLVAARVISADRLMTMAHRRGRGI